MTTTPALNDDLVRELNERAASYRLGGPSSEHTAALLEQAAEEIEALRAALEPFAEAAAYHAAFDDERGVRSDGDVTVGHLRRARNALKGA